MNQTAKRLTSLLLLSLFFSSLSFPLPTSAQTLDTQSHTLYLPLITKPAPPDYELLNNYSILLNEDNNSARIYGEVANHTSTDKSLQITIRGYDSLGDFINKTSANVFTPANDRTCFFLFMDTPQPYLFDHFKWDPLIGLPIEYQWVYSLDSAMTVTESQIIIDVDWGDAKWILITGKFKNISPFTYLSVYPIFTLYSNSGRVIECAGGNSIEDVAPQQTSVFSSGVAIYIKKIFELITYRIQWFGRPE